MSSRSKQAARGGSRSAQRQSARKPSFTKQYRGAILAAAGAIVVVGLIGFAVLQSTNSEPGESRESTALDQAVFENLTNVPASVFQEVGTGSASNPPKAISGVSLTEDGKPEILYVSAEYCPFCAALRWPLFMALSRFGTFDGLLESHSAADDVFPNTPTISFYGSTYQSDYLAFTPVEQYTNQRVGGSYERLQELTDEQQNIVSRFNTGGGIPFLYMAGEYVASGASFSPNLLTGLTVAEIAERIGDASTNQSKAIIGSANVLTAALCELTGGEPGSVCDSPEVVQAASQLQ